MNVAIESNHDIMPDHMILRGYHGKLIMMYDGSNMSSCISTMRTWSGYTQEQLAENSGLSIGSIRQYEQGTRLLPSFANLMAICKACGFTRIEL